MGTIPVLSTQRLRLRPFSKSDAMAVHEMLQGPEIAANTTNIPFPYPDGAAQSWIESHADRACEGTAFTWAIDRLSDQILMGATGLHVDQYHHRGVLGYWLGAAYWNYGYMTEAAKVVVAWGFNELGLHRIEATCFPWNPASARVMEKIGMRYEGTMRGYIYQNDEFADLQLYAILRSDSASAVRAGRPGR